MPASEVFEGCRSIPPAFPAFLADLWSNGFRVLFKV